MSNLSNSYSLTELCSRLNQSPSWIKKVEKFLSLKGWSSGQRGKKSLYNVHHYEFFKKVIILRFLDYGLEDIKLLFDKEMEIINFSDRHFPVQKGGDWLAIDLYLLTNVYVGAEGQAFDKEKFLRAKEQRKAEAATLDKLNNEYRAIMKGVALKLNDMQGYLIEEFKVLKSYL